MMVVRHKRVRGAAAVAYAMAGMAALQPASASALVPATFGRYEVILSRRPFGAGAAEEAAVAAPPPAAPPPAFLANLRMCAITDRGGRVRVGFVDNSARPPRTYFLFVGDTEDGFELLRADYEAESAVLQKDGHEMEITMGGGGRPVSAAAVAAAAGHHQAPPPARRTASARPAPVRTRLTRDRYEAERESGERGEPVSPRRALPSPSGMPPMDELPPEVREYAMRQYNLELIRSQGDKGVPLPIPLTPEEDAMLVDEGVLSPP